MEISPNIDNTLTNSSLQEARSARFANLAKKGELIGKNLPEAEKARIAKASRGFEAIFVNMMMKQMKAGIMKNPSESSMTFGAETLEGHTNMLFAEEVANQGKGIGIAEMMYKQLSGGDELPNKIQSKSGDMNLVDLLKNSTLDNSAIMGSDNKGNFIDKLKGRLSNYESIIDTAATTFGVDKSLIKSVIAAESAGKSDAVSKAGAKGLMQIMDGTAQELGIKNVFNPKENITGGTKYLKNMMDRFGDKDKALAAYNAGAANIDKYGDIPPFPETQSYVKNVNKYLKLFKADNY
jgi:Rod binding domain-containing protein